MTKWRSKGLVQLRAAVKLFKDPKDPKSVVYLPVEQYRNMAAQQIEQLAKDPDQLVNFGEFQLREGHAPELGLQALEKALELRPDDVRTLVALGNAYRMTGQHPRAIQTLHRVTELAPQDARGFFIWRRLATPRATRMAKAPRSIVCSNLIPNFQPAIAIRHGLEPGRANPEIEGQIAAFAEARNSWMAWLIASSLARDRGDLAAAQQRAERAFAINPDAEDVLLHYSSILADTKDSVRLADAIEPAIRRGKYSKRLDWNYAQALRQLGRTNEAIALLRDAAAAPDAQADLKQAAGHHDRLSGTGLPRRRLAFACRSSPRRRSSPAFAPRTRRW
jgi:tetratricopeptide (TPR) repeat protein